MPKILMCRPDYYGVEYSINPWMDVKNGVSCGQAVKEWQQLHDLIIQLGAAVEYVQPRQGLPDMVFTANAGLVLRNEQTVILSQFKFKQRQNEEHHFASWFVDNGFNLIEYRGFKFEGAGDAIYSEDKLFAGYGFRSSKSVYEEYIGPHIEDEIIYCELKDPRFYHLDTCFCPLPGDRAIFYPGAFKNPEIILENIDAHSVPEEEAINFACNAVILENTVIIPSNCPRTCDILKNLEFDVLCTPMSEYIKAGGACKCLTLKVES